MIAGRTLVLEVERVKDKWIREIGSVRWWKRVERGVAQGKEE